MIALRWFPNSWFEIVWGKRAIHVDPVVLAGRTDEMPAGLAQADLVLVTHHHPDHCSVETVAAVSTAETVLAAPPVAAEHLGPGTRIVRPGDEFAVAGINVRVVDAYNTPEGSSTMKAHVRGECVGYVMTVDGRRIYHAGDTDLIPEMSGLGEVDIALLPIGGTYTMDAEEAARAADAIAQVSGKMLAIPMHVRDASAEPFVAKLALTRATPKVLHPGEKLEL